MISRILLTSISNIYTNIKMKQTNISVALLIFWISFSVKAQEKIGKADLFAQIGNMVQGTRAHLLEDKLPPILPEIYLPGMQTNQRGFSPIDRVDTKEELQQELLIMRERYIPFMSNYAPQLPLTRNKIMLESFKWRIETPEDKLDFKETIDGMGEWEMVKVPHYGPPEGRATTYYSKEFELSNEMLTFENQIIHFNGVDYRAKVFVNGVLVGTHEGFFAPFEFDITKNIKAGKNVLLVKVENDFTTLGSSDENGVRKIGNKMYAAGGLGWDNPNRGWHLCPPGMGIFQDVYIESRNSIHINDVFVRPILEEKMAEVWVEVNNFYEDFKNIKLSFSVYGQNFKDVIIENLEYIPRSLHVPGIGDLAKPTDGKESILYMGYGVNFLKVMLPIDAPRVWNNETPYLYQLQTKVYLEDGIMSDAVSTSFGMRSFKMDTLNTPKGQFYLNGEKVKLRGANTMGYMQQDVFRKDWDQLIDDLLLAKVGNLNFIRLTQRPVQSEIYDFADQLGIMLQTDLPLFGGLRPNLFAEGVKQAGEMERLVRNHPSNILITYINERFPNGEGTPQRNMSNIQEYYRFFKACDQIVLQNNPDRVIKAGDGDYDPPSPGLPDSHCYNTWYNGHALGLGELHKGYWQKVKPGWAYACGEFGSEAFDNYEVVKKYWPKEWLPKDESKPWSPDKVALAQSDNFHHMWYPTPVTLKDWIEASQNHQAWATRLVTEAFRRDTDMMSFAIHLFIDAWPAGWMKAIMDVDRNPKKAFFVYRDALAPIMVNLRTDRYHFFEQEEVSIEAWLCNDFNVVPNNYILRWQLEDDDKVILSSQKEPKFPINSAKFQGYIKFKVPKVSVRSKYKLRMALFDSNGEGVSESLIDLDFFPKKAKNNRLSVYTPSLEGKARLLLDELNVKTVNDINNSSVIIVDNIDYYEQNKSSLDQLVRQGRTLILLELPEGEFKIGESQIAIENTIMGQYYFVSPKSGHSMMESAESADFKFWYNDSKGLVTPLLNSMLKADAEWLPILKTGKTTWVGMEGEYSAVAEKKMGQGKYVICQLQLNNRILNPTAHAFALDLVN